MLENLEQKVEIVSALLKSMSHPIRLRILCQLQDGEKTVGNLQAEIQTTHANISQHLSILRNQGIVGSRRDANFIYNRIADHRVMDLVHTLQKLYCEEGR
jgi:ArsR family transcriptional regulator